MTCLVAQRQSHQALAARLGADPRVAAVDVIPAADDPSGSFTTEAVLQHEVDTVPPAVLRAIADAGLGIADVTPRARFGDLRVVVR